MSGGLREDLHDWQYNRMHAVRTDHTNAAHQLQLPSMTKQKLRCPHCSKTCKKAKALKQVRHSAIMVCWRVELTLERSTARRNTRSRKRCTTHLWPRQHTPLSWIIVNSCVKAVTRSSTTNETSRSTFVTPLAIPVVPSARYRTGTTRICNTCVSSSCLVLWH